MTIYCLKKFSSQDQFDTSVEEEFFATRGLALKALNECREDFKAQLYKGKPILTFSEDAECAFRCTDGKWNYAYTVYPVEVQEE